MNTIAKIKELVNTLNTYRDEYYNNNKSLITDKQYDDLFDELTRLENETNYVLSNSPTQTVGYIVQSKLNKSTHTHSMLSLDKTTSEDRLLEFMKKNNTDLMLKDDGLTITIEYNNGILTKAESRGDGQVGEDVTANVKQFDNVPLTINKQGKYTIDGEAIITYDQFDKINKELNMDNRFKNPRNLASGTVRQLNTKITKQRKVKFLAWRVIDGSEYNSHFQRLQEAEELGFEITDMINCNKLSITNELLSDKIRELQFKAENKSIPIDGLVAVIDDIEYGNSLGMTGHHPKHSLAFKFYQEENETILRNVEWNVTRTGLVNPVAIFDIVEIDGADVSRATLHNLNIIEDLQLGLGDTITVIKANQIIPKVTSNLTRSNTLEIPKVCPICGHELTIEVTDSSKVLKCNNPMCSAKLLDNLVNFVSRKCFNVDGLSEATLDKLIKSGFIRNYIDIFHLDQYRKDIIKMDGMGLKSYNNLIKSIDNARQIKPENFLASLGIDGVGLQTAKTIVKKFDIEDIIENKCNYLLIDGVGNIVNDNIKRYMNENNVIVSKLYDEVQIITSDNTNNNALQDKVFVITGSLIQFKNRNELVERIENLGGKVSGSVSTKTSYLINNDKESDSSKNKKAKQLGVNIISEQDFINMIK